MKGNAKVIDALNDLLAGELSSMDQYFIHSRMYEDWGFQKLFERIDHEFDDEKGHASLIIQRILFLGGTPNMVARAPLNIGKDVPSMLQSDLDLELKVIVDLRNVMALCEQVRDYQTRDMLQVLLDDTENDHTHWLEQQVGLIGKIGLQNYLQSQM
ncbi:bacterioferritin [Oceanisphaera profunda]|uniref:Bacterioferritin n=1 Tax=Oceanisphaera profunda TaxID=1416627 RepID=A0A1Y0D342_9GAMM|nr:MULTISPECIES: bacterioferritin [Oceanisphaera]ART81951.1 bacterioferritin [Oceanisphaera profunda]